MYTGEKTWVCTKQLDVMQQPQIIPCSRQLTKSIVDGTPVPRKIPSDNTSSRGDSDVSAGSSSGDTSSSGESMIRVVD